MTVIINYDIDADIKICKFLNESTPDKVSTMTDLRVNTISSSPLLDKHLTNLEKWKMIADVKPTGNGKARKIYLIKDINECIGLLCSLKMSMKEVNEYFS